MFCVRDPKFGTLKVNRNGTFRTRYRLLNAYSVDEIMTKHHRNHTFLKDLGQSEHFYVNQITINLQIKFFWLMTKFLGQKIKAAFYGILRQISVSRKLFVEAL